MFTATKLVVCGWSCQRVALALVTFLSAVLLLPTAALAQPSTSSYNFGSQAIGASAAQSLTLTIPSSATLGGIAVSTQGVANLDFTNGGGSCAVGTAYTAGATCTVSVTFKPTLAGWRYGAVVLSDGSGNVLATDYLQGSGTGPQVNYLPGVESSVGSGFSGGTGSMMVDGSGNLYITDSNAGRVLKETWTGTGYTQSTFLSGTNVLSPAAVDGAGNLYMVNVSTSQVQKWTWTGSAYVQTTIGSGLYGPSGAAVDGAGNVYIPDAYNGRVLMETLSAGTYTQSVILTCGVTGTHAFPDSVAVDGDGNLFITGWTSTSTCDASKILKMTPSAGGYTQSTIGSGLQWAGPVVVDGSGNLFVNSNETNQIVMETLSGGSYIQSTVPSSGLDYAWSIAVDGSGNLYVANNGANNAFKIDMADAPSLSFASTPEGATSSDSPKTVQIENVGNAALNFTALSYPVDFPEASGDANACTNSTSLSPGLMCDVPINFIPETGGPLGENVTLTDNALNVTGAQESIAVSGLGISPTSATQFSITTTATVVAGTPFSITVTALTGSNSTATTYNGTVSFTSSDPGFVNPGPLTLSSGVGQATVTLETVGAQTITATDTTTSSLTGSGNFSVAPTPPPPPLVTYTGSAANQNFGSQAIGSPTAATTLNFSVAAGTTIGSIAVVTQGAPNLDFANATGGTCTATTYATTTTCTVNVTFKPRFAGWRKGAVVFYSAANNTGDQLGSVPIYGVGTGPQIAYGPGAVVNILSEIGGASLEPAGMAVDGAGDLFIADRNGPGVVEVPAGGHTYTEIYPAAPGTPFYPTALAVDGAGNLFVSNQEAPGEANVLEVPAGGGATIAIQPVVNGTGLNYPVGLAMDGAGNLFIADFDNNRVVEVPAGNGATTAIAPTVAGKALNQPTGVALDVAGDLFIADYGNNRVVEVPAGGGAATAIDPTVDGLGLSGPTIVAVDGAGNLFITDYGNNRLVEVPAGGGAATVTLVAGHGQINWVTLDDAGDQFISAYPGQGLLEVQRSQPPAINFPTPTSVGATDTTDGTQTVQIENVGTAALDFTALSYPVDFPVAGGDANACTGSTSLSGGQECDLPIEFTPENGGPLGESVTLTDNALNVAGTQQSIAVSGLGVSPTSATQFSITTTASVVAGTPFSITVTALTGSNSTATTYNGTVSFTSSDPGFVNPGPLTLSSGVGQATVTLETTGTQTITATDTTTSSLTGTGSFSVLAPGSVVYTGSASSQNFGSQAVGSSTVQTLSFSIPAGDTVGSIGVLTQGAPNLDFTNATGGTCTASTYSSATTCTVNVTFAPRFAGERYGAVVFYSEAGNTGTVLGSALIYGIGTGPEVIFSPAALRSLGGGFNNPYGVAVDGSGNVYVANASVYEMPPGCASSSCVTELGGGFSFAQDVAVDGSGNVYVADWGGGAVYEMPPGCASSSCVTELGGGISTPTAVAVDRSGNVYAVEWEGGAVKEMPPGCASSSCVTTLGGGFTVPSGVAVDGSGNVFVTDGYYSLGLVKEMPPGCLSSSCVTTLGGGFIQPSGIAVDGSGNIYVADYSNGTVKEMAPGCASSSCVTTLGTGFNNPGGGSVAVDGSGNLYVASYCINCGGAVYEMERATPPTLSFPTPTGVGTTDTTDGTQTVQVQNIGNAALTLKALSYPVDFPEASGDGNACTASTSLSPGLVCDVPVKFTPENSGPLSESVTLTDNALNVVGAQQAIAVSGTGEDLRATLTSPTVGTTLGVSNITFSWSSLPGTSVFRLYVGINGPGSSDVFVSGETTATSVVVPSIPGLGSTIYARLFTLIGESWQYKDYTFTMATPELAKITSHTLGETLGTSNITFTWSPGTGVSHYRLYLGINGPGSSDMFVMGQTSNTSVVVPSLPGLGVTLYARLFTLNPAIPAWQYNDYTYTMAAPVLATMTSPTAGTTVGTSNITLTWSPGNLPPHYRLYAGLNGTGSSSLFVMGETSATSVVIPTLPKSGATLYVRLFTLNPIAKEWQYNDYVYALTGP